MKFPNVWSWIFALKTFLSLLLTLYIAFSLDLPKPYWAAVTVYVVAQPLGGALRSKAAYRFLGTLLGAITSVILVPNLVNSPELLSLVLAGWVGLCLYISLLDRSPRSYVFMLAGYTTAIVALPTVTDPGSIFATALARTEEITLAIVCTVVVDSIFFPVSIGPMLTEWVNRCERGVREWATAAFRGEPFSLASLATDLGLVTRLENTLAYDPSHLGRATRQLGDLHARMLMLLPALSSVDDRVRELGRLPEGIPPQIRSLLDEATAWSTAEQPHPREVDALREKIRAVTPHLTATSDWKTIIVSTLLLRLREVLELMQDCRLLRAYLAQGPTGPSPHLIHSVPHAVRVLHIDHGMAAWSGFAAALAVCVCCAAWIMLAWPEGAIAVQMAAVACCLFATLDNPAPMIRSFVFQQVPGMLVGIVYAHAVLPLVTTFEMLALVLAPAYLLAGLLLTVPSLYGWGLGLIVNTTMTIAFQTSYSADFSATINNDIATLLGMGGAAILTGMIRSVGSAWAARRLVHANRREIIALTRQRSVGTRMAAAQRNRLMSIMMDRLGQLIPRLAAGHDAEKAAEAALSRLRVGLNIVDVQRLRRGLPPPVVEAVARLLAELGTYLGTLAGHDEGAPPPFSLCAKLDDVIAAVSGGPESQRESALMLALVGIRRGVFPSAQPYMPDRVLLPASRRGTKNL
jgi:uncharacterized membrane protein YccC